MKERSKLLAIYAFSLLAFVSSTSQGVLLLEDGFAAGGDNPLPNQYRSDPVSTNGLNNDSIIGQGPALTGFDAGANWVNLDAVAGFVYPRVLDSGLSFSNGSQVLVTSDGAVDWHRDSSANATKRITRDTNLVPSLPNVGYFSALVQFTEGVGGQIEFLTDNAAGTSTRFFLFGVNADGDVIAGTDNVDVTVATGLAAGETHLLFGELTNSGTNDLLRLWLNPSDLSDPTGDAPIINSVGIGAGWVGSNSGFTVRELRLFADTSVGEQFIFDEIRLGTTPGDVMPFIVLPEPTTAMLAMAGMGMLGLRRRRVA